MPPLSPVAYDSNSNKVTLSFENNETSLANIDAQYFHRRAVHVAQTKESCLRDFVTNVEMKKTFDWVYVVDKLDPKKRTQAVPDSPSEDLTGNMVGINCHAYDGGSFLIDYVVKNATIEVDLETFVAYQAGYERTFDKVAIAAMLQPIRRRKSSGSDEWKTADSTTDEISLPNTNIGGRISRVSSTDSLAKPSMETFQKVYRFFRDKNILGQKIYALMTPGMEEFIESLPEYKNRDYIWHVMNDPQAKTVRWYKFHFVKTNPDVNPGSVYGSLYLKGGSSNSLARATATSSSNFDLTDDNHEVVPFWTKDNIINGHVSSLDKMDIIKRGDKHNTPQALLTKWMGGSRHQNIKQFNLVIPSS